MEAVNLQSLSRAIEARDSAALGSFYTDDAVLLIIDHLNPPHLPREIKGHDGVRHYFDDICGRAMTHVVENGIQDSGRLAFTQTCQYPDGKSVFCSATASLVGGKIARQVMVQAWDE
ncbi:MAG TPA: nuclear transport factor 2 family protein [Acidisoma sp.]|uniref:nuclear transport factor 2 family protein n=1 Tax=Acidisoma sp. TaxID=1872115 RepID=UPI002C6FE018|nr:nuclear transport factor 2 family protein [Acidisoma sp.]HTI00631.1 nuclear transport factor 2 family protein [Acidisoma sp.]